MTLQEFVPRRSGPLLRVGKEKACVPDGLRDHARVGREKQPGWKHLRPQKKLLAHTHHTHHTHPTQQFEQAGITEVPDTWDELAEAAKKIGALGDDIAGFGLQGKEIETDMSEREDLLLPDSCPSDPSKQIPNRELLRSTFDNLPDQDRQALAHIYKRCLSLFDLLKEVIVDLVRVPTCIKSLTDTDLLRPVRHIEFDALVTRGL